MIEPSMGWTLAVAVSVLITAGGFAATRGQLSLWIIATCSVFVAAAVYAVHYAVFVEHQREFGKLLEAPMALGFWLPQAVPGAVIATLSISAVRTFMNRIGKRN